MNTNNDNEATRFQAEENENTLLENENTINKTVTDNETENISEEDIEVSPTEERAGWKRVTIGGVTGIVLGAAATFLMGMKKAEPDKPEPTPKPEPEPNVEEEPIQPVWSDGELSIATSVTDDMSFGEAFAAARAEVGPGGAFEWHGNVYATYTADEWNAMTPQQIDEFEDHFSWNQHSSYNSTVHHTASTSSQHNSSTTAQTSTGDEKDDIDVVSVDHKQPEIASQTEDVSTHNDEPELEVLGVTLDVDNGMSYGEIRIEGHEGLLVDIDGDMKFDRMGVDINDDHHLQPNEIADVSEYGWTVDSLGGYTGVTGDIFSSIDETDLDPFAGL